MYREVAGWSTEEKVAHGAHVYFRGLMWPFTSHAGIDDQIDWAMPGEATQPAWAIFTGGLPPEEEMAQPLFGRLEAES